MLDPRKLVHTSLLTLLLAGGLSTFASASEKIDWAAGFEEAMGQAETEKKVVMVDFYTHWCHWCKVLDQKTYSDDGVAALADQMISVKVNAGTEVAIAKRYGVSAYPTIFFLNPDGTVRKKVRGFKPPDGFIPIMNEVLNTEGEQYYLSNQLKDKPTDKALREDYARLLALSGKHLEAAAQIDERISLGSESKEDEAALQLEALIYRYLGNEEMETVQKGLESWTKKQKKHPSYEKGLFYQAKAADASGQEKEARKLYEKLAKAEGETWYVEAATERLAELSS